MTHSREIFQMDGHQASEKISGRFFSKKHAFLLILFFFLSLIITALLTNYFTSKSLENVEDFLEITEKPCGGFDALDIEKHLEKDWMRKPESKERKNVRLPKSIVPYTYDIRIIPFILENNFTFVGEVRIGINVTHDTDRIVLHAKDLEIDVESIKVNHVNGENYQVHRTSNDTNLEFFIIHVRHLKEGQQYSIRMSYTGHLNNELRGFYRSSYGFGDSKRWLGATQFQATDARRAFPCFDEPALKSRFKISIGRPEGMKSISNMPLKSTGKPVAGLPNYIWDEFEESVPMSTYLVAFVVSDFTKLSNGDRFSVWVRPSAVSQVDFTLEIGPKILKYFEDYFGIEFPLPKMDLLALPDMAAGAMENWGLVTFRETAMLYQSGVSNSKNKERVATVVSHEFAHQWFGNLVTPSWWNDLWLNEGFASYVEYLGVEAVRPSWRIMEQFVVDEVQNVFALDALRTSHEISVPVHDPDEINEIFDRISYGKGASIIRMMDHFLTTDVFKRGLSKYLNRHKFGNAQQNDLWAALTEQAHENNVMPPNVSVKTIMDTWTLQTGFPVVSVTRNYDQNNAVVIQERFLINPSLDKNSDKNLWWVPITYTSAGKLLFNSTYPSHWLKQEKKILLDNMPPPNEWLIFNVQQTGFYRVNYDEKNWRLLIDYLENSDFNKISPVNRAQLLDDSLNLARAGLLSYDIALNVTSYLSKELEYLPWKSASVAFSYLQNMLVRTSGFEKFKVYILKLINNLYEEVGFTNNPDDPQLTIYKRIRALSWACSLGHSDCVDNSIVQFQKWKNMSEPDKNNPISPDLKRVVYCTAIRAGGEEEWNFAWERYLRSNVASEKDLLLDSLGCTREVWILTRVLDWALTDNSGIRKQDIARVFSSVANNPIGQPLVFGLLTEQWSRIKNYLGSSLFSISSIVKSASNSINTKSQLKQLVEFSKSCNNEFGAAKRAVNQGIEQSNANIEWMERNYLTIVNWLSNAVR